MIWRVVSLVSRKNSMNENANETERNEILVEDSERIEDASIGTSKNSFLYIETTWEK